MYAPVITYTVGYYHNSTENVRWGHVAVVGVGLNDVKSLFSEISEKYAQFFWYCSPRLEVDKQNSSALTLITGSLTEKINIRGVITAI